jgi:hypothetical protein
VDPGVPRVPRLAVRDDWPMSHLVAVARAEKQAEAEFLRELPPAEGVPSTPRRAPRFEAPCLLGAGPRDVLVAPSAEPDTRDLLPLRSRGTDR